MTRAKRRALPPPLAGIRLASEILTSVSHCSVVERSIPVLKESSAILMPYARSLLWADEDSTSTTIADRWNGTISGKTRENTMTEPFVVEVWGEPAGIVLKEGNAFRFH